MSNSDISRIRNDSEKSENQRAAEGATTIRRTLIERGVRPVSSNQNNEGNSSGQSSNTAAITTIARQHEDDQRELQELNAKFSVYLDRVHYLEDYNRKLTADLDRLKQTWGGDALQLQSAFGPQLQALRAGIDNVIRDQTLQELQLKRFEYDSWQIQQQIAAFDPAQDAQRFSLLKQQLDGSSQELELLKNQFDQRLSDLARQRHAMENLLNDLDAVKNELDTRQLERIIIENELQTLREHGAFQDAIYQSQRAEILTLSKTTRFRAT